jgi:hypothetical protein
VTGYPDITVAFPHPHERRSRNVTRSPKTVNPYVRNGAS